MTLLAAIGGSGTILSRADLFVSQNLLSGVQALWLAQAGAEVGKNWLENNLPGAAFPIAIGPETLGAGIYTVRIEDLDDGSIGLRPSDRAMTRLVVWLKRLSTSRSLHRWVWLRVSEMGSIRILQILHQARQVRATASRISALMVGITQPMGRCHLFVPTSCHLP